MQYHDFSLVGYSVSDRGSRIILHLENQIGTERSVSEIEFENVAAYRFDHSDAAIITEIGEGSVASFVVDEQSWIEEAARTIGLRYWTGNLRSYQAALEKRKFRYWMIESAIGFTGKIVAELMREKTAQPGATDNPDDAQR